MHRSKNKLRETEYQVENIHQTNPQQVEIGMWVFEIKTPQVPMFVSKMLGYGMCEVIYGKSLPFRVYKKRLATLRPLKPEEMYLVNNAAGREIEHVAKSA